MTSLTTHVLDQVSGLPGRGILIELFRVGAARELLSTVRSNDDGRTDRPLLEGPDAVSGQYELVFYAGDYFRQQGLALADPAFLDEVVIRFGLSDSLPHYHVPLLLSPYGYSTYRGS